MYTNSLNSSTLVPQIDFHIDGYYLGVRI